MKKPIREWKARCPQCDQIHVYPEFPGGMDCSTQICRFCKTEFICPSYLGNCVICMSNIECMGYPTITPLIHRSTWTAMYKAFCFGLRKLAFRDLECVFYVRGEVDCVKPDIELFHMPELVSPPVIKVQKKSRLKSKKPTFQIYMGSLGRRKDA